MKRYLSLLLFVLALAPRSAVARTYDAGTGRFLQPDPIGFEGDDTNLYRAVNNNPLLYIDTTGLAACIYNSLTGKLSCVNNNGGSFTGPGFVSGQPPFQNNPGAIFLPNQGPIPPGMYYIGPQLPSSTRRRLYPAPGTRTFGRGGFQTHACPNTSTCSGGCVAGPVGYGFGSTGDFNTFLNLDDSTSYLYVE